MQKTGGDAQIEPALLDLIADLERNHKRFMQDTYYAGDSVRIC